MNIFRTKGFSTVSLGSEFITLEIILKRYIQLTKTLSIIGLLGGLIATILIMISGDTFGLPGSTDYRVYENFNRVMALLLFFQACTLIAFYQRIQDDLPRLGQITNIVVIVAWIGMAVGTAAEFWLYSDLPYGVSNMRSTAFSVFSISGLFVGIGLLVLGIVVLRNRRIPRYNGIIFILYLPVDIVLFIGGQSIFISSALLSIVVAIFTLRSNSQPVGSSIEAA